MDASNYTSAAIGNTRTSKWRKEMQPSPRRSKCKLHAGMLRQCITEMCFTALQSW